MVVGAGNMAGIVPGSVAAVTRAKCPNVRMAGDLVLGQNVLVWLAGRVARM